MDWKDVLRRRLASPNTDSKREFGRDSQPDSPPQAKRWRVAEGVNKAGRRKGE